MKEIKSLRGKREKHFLKNDGTMVAYLYDYDVHYLKDGKYEEIDNTIIEDGDKFYNKNNFLNTIFEKNINNRKLIEIKKDSYYFNMFINDKKNSNMKINYKKNKVNYCDILDNIDFKYEIIGSKLKESIVLKDKKNIPEKISFIIDTDLELYHNSNNTISVCDGDKSVFVIDAPFMFDSNNNYNKNIGYKLIKMDSCYLLNLELDNEWLNDINTIYPVIIDPTLIVNESGNIFDTYISSDGSSTVMGSDSKLKIGVDKVNGVDSIYRTLIKFNLPTIATGSIVTGAYLSLVSHADDLGASYSTIYTDVHAINNDWSENTATWDNMYDKYNTRIEDYAKTRKSTISIEEDDSPIINLFTNEFNITNLVKRWYAGEPNYGIMLKKHIETYQDADNIATYYSKSHGLTSNNPAPFLMITYRNQNGLEDYYSYDELLYSDGASYINRNNGNLVNYFTLNTTLNGRFPANIGIYYNTNDFILNKNYGYGLGYKFNYHQEIKEVTIDDIPYLEYLDADATLHYFYKDENDNYYDEDGLGYTAVKQDDNYVITSKDNSKLIFEVSDGVWYLKTITNSNNDSIYIIHNSDNRVVKIVDADSQEINITYEENKIVLSSKYATTIMNYNGNKLVSIVTKNGTTLINYNNLNIIDSIVDVNGKSIKFLYYDVIPYRIKQVSEYGLNDTLGNYLTYKYGFEVTTVTDNKGKINTYSFNANGSVVGMTNLDGSDKLKDGYGKTQFYYTNSGNRNNKLSTNNNLVKYVKNYIPNSSFEDENTIFYSDGETVVRSSSFSNTGNYSLRIVISDVSNGTNASFNVPKGNWYTFSAYIKGSGTIQLGLSYKNSDGDVCNSYVEADNNDVFTRSDVSIFYPEDAVSDLTINITGSFTDWFYIDDVQLKEGKVANCYNLIENSDFSNGLNGWNITSSVDEEVSVETPLDEIITLSDGNKALMLNADPYVSKILERQIVVNGNKNDTYNLSFWYKDTGIYPSLETSIYGNFNLALVNFHYINEVEGVEPYIVALVPNGDEWKFSTGNFTAMEDHDYITVTVMNLNNANKLYLTDFSLFKDLGNSSYYYDDNGNLIYAVSNDGETNEFKYDKNNQLISSFDKMGNNLKFEYHNVINNRLLSGISPTGIFNGIKYDSYGNPVKTLIKNVGVNLDNDSSFCYIRSKGCENYLNISFGNLQIKSQENTCSHDTWILEKVDTNYRIKHPVVQKYVSLVSDSIILSSDTDNSLFQITNLDNGSVTFNLVDTMKYLSVLDGVLVIKTLELENDVLDDNSIQFYIENIDSNLFIESKAEYSEDGKVITKIVDSLENVTTFDVNSNTGLTNSVTDAKGNVVNYTYNEKEQLTKVSKDNMSVSYQYNNQNLLSKIKTGNKEYNFEYDNFLNNKVVKIGNNTLITNNYLENNGNLGGSTYGNGDVVSFNYDDFNRLNKVIKMNDVYEYYYNNLGDLAKVISNNDVYKYGYDFAKRLARYKFNDFMIDYTYDQNSNVSDKYYYGPNNNIVSYQYNEENAISKMTYNSKGNHEINYVYDSLGRIIEYNINNIYKVNYDYVTNGKKTSTLVKSLTINGDVYGYKYDKLNNIRKIYKNNELLNEYEYDKYNELVKENDYVNDKTIRYVYDNAGNILIKNEYEINTFNLLNSNKYSYENVNWEDQLTNYNGSVITYDEIGNPLTIGENITLNWINGRQLNSYIDTNKNLNINYNYNKDGIRIKKNVNNVLTNYYIEGNKIIFEQKGNNVLYYIRDNEGKLVGLRYNDVNYYYVLNLQGDVIAILDGNYDKVATYEYDSWGKITAIKDNNGNDVSNDLSHIANINPFRYRSYYYDLETGLYYLNSRYYNPEIGRFINADGFVSTGQGLLGNNMFIYCANNPINSIDNNGLFFKSVINKVKKGIKNFVESVTTIVKACFGFQSSVVSASDEPYVNKNIGVDGTIGFKKTTGTSSNKTTVFYSEIDEDNFASSSVGVQHNGIFNSHGNVNLGLSDTSIGVGFSNHTVSFGFDATKMSIYGQYSYTTSVESETMENYYRVDFKPYVALLILAAGVTVTHGGVAIVGALAASGALVPAVDMAVQAIA